MSEESGLPSVPVEIGTPSPRKPKLLLSVLTGLIVLAGCAVVGVWIYNEVTLQKPLQRVLVADQRNHAITVKAHFDGWIDTHSVVFDLADIA